VLGEIGNEVKGDMYHFVHGDRAVSYCDEADYYAEDVVPSFDQRFACRIEATVAYMTVLFFSLYLACIWSILGTWLCRVSFVVLSHLRVGVSVGLRVRGNRDKDREHDEHVQDSNARSDWCRSGDARDIEADVRSLWRRL
jgi:hypothetical protein